MENKTNAGVWVGIGVAVVLSLIALTIARSSVQTSSVPVDSSGISVGAVNGGNVTNFDAVQTINGYWTGVVKQLGILSTGYSVTSIGSSAGTLDSTAAVGTSCNTASSTLFAIAPPEGATSTASLVLINIGGNATTSNLLVGTSTKSTGLAASDVSPSLINSTNGIATSTAVWGSSGNTIQAGNGFISAGSGSQIRVMVKPGEFVVGFSTTTATGGGAAGYTPGFTTCTYKILYQS